MNRIISPNGAPLGGPQLQVPQMDSDLMEHLRDSEGKALTPLVCIQTLRNLREGFQAMVSEQHQCKEALNKLLEIMERSNGGEAKEGAGQQSA